VIEVRIGVIESPKELSLEMDETADELAARLDTALPQSSGLLWLTDRKGKRVGVPVARIAYVEIEPEKGARSVGFAP